VLAHEVSYPHFGWKQTLFHGKLKTFKISEEVALPMQAGFLPF
jgi:hypothetical protein